MIEKFSDYESVGFIATEGEFTFEVKKGELKDSSKGTPMVVLDVEAPEGKTSLYMSLNPKARWKYNNLIKACLAERLNTPEKRAAFELDYETIHNELIGKKFIGKVECESYDKVVKTPQDDGTFLEETVKADSYKIIDFKAC